MLELEEMNRHIFTMDALWFTVVVHKRPLAPFLDDSVRQYANLVQKAFAKALHELLTMNAVDFNVYPSIVGLVAAKNPALEESKGYHPDY